MFVLTEFFTAVGFCQCALLSIWLGVKLALFMIRVANSVSKAFDALPAIAEAITKSAASIDAASTLVSTTITQGVTTAITATSTNSQHQNGPVTTVLKTELTYGILDALKVYGPRLACVARHHVIRGLLTLLNENPIAAAPVTAAPVPCCSSSSSSSGSPTSPAGPSACPVGQSASSIGLAAATATCTGIVPAATMSGTATSGPVTVAVARLE